MLSILRNSAHTLTDLYVGCGKQWWWLLDGRIWLPALRSVDVVISDDEDLVHICQSAPNLLKMELMKPHCSSVGVAMIGKCCQKLVSFTYIGTKALQLSAGGDGGEVSNLDEGFGALATGCTKLTHLNLTSAFVTDYGLGDITTHCSQLQELTIAYNSLITDAPLITLAHTAGVHLQSLCLNGCDYITGSGLVAIATHCTALHTLRIQETKSPLLLTVANLKIAIPLFVNVRTFSLSYNKLDDATVELIATRMPMLEDLDIFCDQLCRIFTQSGLQKLRCRYGVYRI